MEEVTVVEVKPQLVAGIRKRGHYREIAELLSRLYEYATKKVHSLRLHQFLYVMRHQKKP